MLPYSLQLISDHHRHHHHYYHHHHHHITFWFNYCNAISYLPLSSSSSSSSSFFIIVIIIIIIIVVVVVYRNEIADKLQIKLIICLQRLMSFCTVRFILCDSLFRAKRFDVFVTKPESQGLDCHQKNWQHSMINHAVSMSTNCCILAMSMSGWLCQTPVWHGYTGGDIDSAWCLQDNWLGHSQTRQLTKQLTR